MSTILVPSTDLTAVEWLRLINGLPSTSIGTTLPAADAVLRSTGFIQVTGTGGTPSRDFPLHAPVVTVDCWAAPAVEGSAKVPWGRATDYAGLVWLATFDWSLMNRKVTLPHGYPAAWVRTAIALSEPRRIPDDPSGFARVQVDVLLNWSAA